MEESLHPEDCVVAVHEARSYSVGPVRIKTQDGVAGQVGGLVPKPR